MQMQNKLRKGELEKETKINIRRRRRRRTRRRTWNQSCERDDTQEGRP